MSEVEFKQLCDELKKKKISMKALKLADEYAASMDYNPEQFSINAFYNFAQTSKADPYDAYLGAYTLHQASDGKSFADSLEEFVQCYNFQRDLEGYYTEEQWEERDRELDQMSDKIDRPNFFANMLCETMRSYGFSGNALRKADDLCFKPTADGAELLGVPLHGRRFQKAYQLLGSAPTIWRPLSDSATIYKVDIDNLARNRNIIKAAKGEYEHPNLTGQKNKFEKVYIEEMAKAMNPQLQETECQEELNSYERTVIKRANERPRPLTRNAVDLVLGYGKYMDYNVDRMNASSMLAYLKHTSFSLAEGMVAGVLMRNVLQLDYNKSAESWGMASQFNDALVDCLDIAKEAEDYFVEADLVEFRSAIKQADVDDDVLRRYVCLELLWAGMTMKEQKEATVDEIDVDGDVLRYRDIVVENEFVAELFRRFTNRGKNFSHVFYWRYSLYNKEPEDLLNRLSSAKVFNASKSDVYYSGVMHRHAIHGEKYPHISDPLYDYYVKLEKYLYS